MAVAAVLGVAPAASAQDAGRVPLGTSIQTLFADPAGGAWITALRRDGGWEVGHTLPDGGLRLQRVDEELRAATLGPDGALWFTDDRTLYRTDAAGTRYARRAAPSGSARRLSAGCGPGREAVGAAAPGRPAHQGHGAGGRQHDDAQASGLPARRVHGRQAGRGRARPRGRRGGLGRRRRLWAADPARAGRSQGRGHRWAQRRDRRRRSGGRAVVLHHERRAVRARRRRGQGARVHPQRGRRAHRQRRRGRVRRGCRVRLRGLHARARDAGRRGDLRGGADPGAPCGLRARRRAVAGRPGAARAPRSRRGDRHVRRYRSGRAVPLAEAHEPRGAAPRRDALQRPRSGADLGTRAIQGPERGTSVPSTSASSSARSPGVLAYPRLSCAAWPATSRRASGRT